MDKHCNFLSHIELYTEFRGRHEPFWRKHRGIREVALGPVKYGIPFPQPLMHPQRHLGLVPAVPSPRFIDSRPVLGALTEIRHRRALLDEMMAGQAQSQVLAWVVSRLESALAEASDSECQYLTAEEAAQMLGLTTPQALTQRARNNRIPNARKEGGKWVIPRAYVDDELRGAA